jgi:hypothetical protein
MTSAMHENRRALALLVAAACGSTPASLQLTN